MEKISGSQAIIRCLQEEGVKTIFGFPGGAVIDLFDALMDSDITNVLVRHEQGAVHAADGLARVTGEVGVALLTSGPGRYQRRHGHCHGLYGFHPHGHPHRPGAHSADRQ